MIIAVKNYASEISSMISFKAPFSRHRILGKLAEVSTGWEFLSKSAFQVSICGAWSREEELCSLFKQNKKELCELWWTKMHSWRLPCCIILYLINTPTPCLLGARFEICSPVFSLVALWISPVFTANLGYLSILACCVSDKGNLAWINCPAKKNPRHQSDFCHSCLCFVTDRVLLLQPGVRPEPLRWESRVQDFGPQEISWPHVISISKSSPSDFRLNTKTQLH